MTMTPIGRDHAQAGPLTNPASARLISSGELAGSKLRLACQERRTEVDGSEERRMAVGELGKNWGAANDPKGREWLPVCTFAARAPRRV